MIENDAERRETVVAGNEIAQPIIGNEKESSNNKFVVGNGRTVQ